MIRQAITILSLLLLVFLPAHAGNRNDIYAAVTKGSVWKLVKPLTIDPQRASVYLQHGKIVAAQKDLDRYATHCEMNFKMKLQDTPRTIEPADFEVTSVSHYRDPIDDLMVIYHNRMKLKSTAYPDVMSLICKAWGDRSDDYPTITEMEKTLQGYFRLQLKKKQ